MMYGLDSLKELISVRVQPYFQPIAPMNGGELSYEALGRIVVDNRIILPKHFLPQLAGTPQMVEFDRAVTRLSIAKIAAWNMAHPKSVVHLHVNVGLESLLDGEYVHFLREMLTQYRFPADFLTVEVVEQCPFWRDQELCKALQRIRALGVALAVDDFPCGGDPEALIRFLEAGTVSFSVLKLDRSMMSLLCRGETTSPAQETLYDQIRRVRKLNVMVVAEGVDRFVLQAVRHMPDTIDRVQGFAVGRPTSTVRPVKQFRS